MSSTFVREAFYVNPPKHNATPAEWEEWMEKDRKAAIQAKRAYTRSQPACELPANAQGTTFRRVNGVWKQSTSIGFVGEGEGNGHLEPMIEATQEKDYILSCITPKNRGYSKSRSGNQKRKARRDRRRAKRLGW